MGGNEGQKTCSICLVDFTGDIPIKMVPSCNHIFHSECLDEWLLKGTLACPFCRRGVSEVDAEGQNIFNPSANELV